MSFTFGIKFSYALASAELVNFYSLMNPRAHSFTSLKKKIIPCCKFANGSEGSLEQNRKGIPYDKIFYFLLPVTLFLLSWEEYYPGSRCMTQYGLFKQIC